MARYCRCGRLIEKGKCEKCYPTSPHKKTNKERGYGSDWDQLSLRFKAHHPLCEDCKANGKIRPATEVHHVESIRENPERRLDWENLIALCVGCHKRRHER